MMILSARSGRGVEIPLAKDGKPGAVMRQLVDLVPDGWFVGKDHGHLGIDLARKIIGKPVPLELCKKGIEPAAKIAMYGSPFAEPAHKRQCAGNCCAATQDLPPQGDFDGEPGSGGRAEQYGEKLKQPAPANKSSLLHVVIKRRAQQLETQPVHVLGGFTPGGWPRVVSIGGLSVGVGRGGVGGFGGLLAHLVAPISNMPPVKCGFMGGVAGRAPDTRGLHLTLAPVTGAINVTGLCNASVATGRAI